MTINYTNNTFYKFKNIASPNILSSNMNSAVASVKIGDIADDKDTDENKKIKSNLKQILLGSISFVTIVGLLLITKGRSRTLTKRLKSFSNLIKNQVKQLNKSAKDLSKVEKLKLKFSKSVDFVANILDASSNFTAIKDSVSLKICKKLKLKNIVDKINVFFKDNIVLKNKNNAYQKAELTSLELQKFLSQISMPNSELSQKTNEVLSEFNKYFSTHSHYNRSENIWSKFYNLDETVFNRIFKTEGGFFKNIKQLKSYITKQVIYPDKKIIVSELTKGKKSINKQLKEIESLLPQDDYQVQKYKALSQKLNKRLNLAIKNEVKTIEKLAELQVGSIPTDIVGVLFPTAVATGLIINSENKNEKVSTALTKGIPILGGIGTSYYGTIKGFTGATNLVLGAVTGLMLNIIGTKTDELYKKYVKKQNLLKEAFEKLNKLQQNTNKI